MTGQRAAITKHFKVTQGTGAWVLRCRLCGSTVYLDRSVETDQADLRRSVMQRHLDEDHATVRA